METRDLYQHVEFEVLDVKEYIAQPYRNTFFEMVFILSGEGIQYINDHRLPYSPDKLFLIFPGAGAVYLLLSK